MRYSLIGREVTRTRCASISAPPGWSAPSPSSRRQARRSARWPRCSSTIGRPSSCRTGSIHPGTDPKTGEAIDLVTAYQVAGHPDAEYRQHRLSCLPACSRRRHLHLQHHADLHRRAGHAAAAHGGAAVRHAPAERVPQGAGWPSREPDGQGPEAARHRRVHFDPQRHDRGDGDRRLDQRHLARAGDPRAAAMATSGRTSSRRRSSTTSPSTSCPCSPTRGPTASIPWSTSGGRHPGRCASFWTRPAERRRDDLHRRDPGGPRSSGWAPGGPTAR